jgi:hypothetical protein
VPCCQRFRTCLSHLNNTVRPSSIHTYHAVPWPWFHHAALQATSQGHGTTRHRHGMVCVKHYRPFLDRLCAICQVRFLSTITRSFTIGSSDFSGYTKISRRTRHCRRQAGAQHGKCKLARHGTAGARHGMVCVNQPSDYLRGSYILVTRVIKRMHVSGMQQVLILLFLSLQAES